MSNDGGVIVKGLKWVFFVFLLVISFAFTTSMTNVFADESENNITISVKVLFDDAEVNTTVKAKYADELIINVDDRQGYDFAYWILNNKIRNLPRDHKFIVTENLEITALFTPNNKHVVVFVDANGDVLKIDWVEDGGSVTAPDVELTLPGYVFTKWDKPLTNIKNNTIIIAEYTKTTDVKYNLTVVNGTILKTGNSTGTIGYNDVVTVVADEAPEGKVFSHWQVGHRVVSTQSTYKFTMLSDLNIKAVYKNEAREDKPFVSISDKVILDNKPTYYGNFYIPDGYTKVEFGFLYTDENVKLELNNEHVKKQQILNYFAETNEFIITFTELDPLFVGTYLVCKDSEGNIVTVYNEEVKDLFISEYGEGSSNNKWIEIYNPFHYEVDLSEYSVKLYTNANDSPESTVQLEGTLKPFSVIVIYHSSSAQEIKNRAKYANISFAHAVANFNGDDVVCLYKNDVLIDIFGVMGEQETWEVPNGNTEDHTIIRNVGIVAPSDIWNPKEWYAYDVDTFTYIGYHVASNESPQQIIIKGSEEVFVGKPINLSAIVYPVGADQRVVWESSDESIATINSFGVVEGKSSGSVIITATSLEYPSISTSITLNVKVVTPTSITISGPNTVKEFKSIQLNATILPNNAVKNVEWVSVDPNIATVDENGVVTGISKGVTLIKAISTVDPNVFGTYEVEVIEATYYSIDIDYDSELGIIQHSPDDLSNILEDSSVEIIIEPIEGYIITQVTINGVNQSVSNPLRFTFAINSISNDYEIKVTFENRQEHVETIIYETGFEKSEGFTAGTNYQLNNVPFGPEGKKWIFFFGTPSTNNKISGDNSAQMRWYDTGGNENKFGYIVTDFKLQDVTKIEFKARNTSKFNVRVSYSFDGVEFINPEVFELSNKVQEYTYNVNVTGEIYIKFELVKLDGASSGSGIIIDDIKVYGIQ